MGSHVRFLTRPVALALALTCAIAYGGTQTARAAPAAGRFLVATRQQQGFFSETVVLLINYGGDGALGLIINRPTKLPLDQALPNVKEIQGSGRSLYLGGPVSLEHLTLLIHSKTPPEKAIHVIDDVYASGSLTVLRALAENQLKGARFRAYAGYAGWAPGQLDAELAHGDWIVVPASTNAVFTKDPAQLWRTLVQPRSLQIVTLDRRTLSHL